MLFQDKYHIRFVQTTEFFYEIRKSKGERIIYYAEQNHETVKTEGFGLIHLNYGPGAGKTTRAIGLAIRAAGEGLKVDFVQFMKSGNSSEVSVLQKILNIRYLCPGKHPFVMQDGPAAVHYEHAAKALDMALKAVEEERQMLICDEILDTLFFGLLQKSQLIDLIARCREKTELIMTGRTAPDEILEAADYATEYIQIKHPYYKGVKARKGIEY